MSRTVEDVEKVVRHAKLDPEHLHTLSQSMYFGQRFLNFSQYSLFKLPSPNIDLK
jgi:hypothetical protein